MSHTAGQRQAEANPVPPNTREKLGNSFQHGVVQLFWLGDYLADRK